LFELELKKWHSNTDGRSVFLGVSHDGGEAPWSRKLCALLYAGTEYMKQNHVFHAD